MTEEKKICKKCGSVKEWRNGTRCKPCQQEKDNAYRSTPKIKEIISRRMKEYNSNGEVKQRKLDYMKGYYSTPEVKRRTLDRLKVYNSIPEIKQRRREYQNSLEVKNRRREYVKQFGGANYSRAKKRGAYAETFNRLDIFKRDKYKCAYCKKRLKIDECILEHKIPIRWGGSHTPANCTTSCQPCNSAKHAKLLNGIQISIFDKVKE